MGLSFSPDGEPVSTPGRTPTSSRTAFGIGVEEHGTTLNLRLTGELDWPCIGRIEAALSRICDGRTRRVVFDLHRLEYMDSAGLRTILRANDRARAEGIELIVVRPRGLANRVFTLTRASLQLTLVDRLEPSDEGT